MRMAADPRVPAFALQAFAVEFYLLRRTCIEQRRALGGQVGVSRNGPFGSQTLDWPLRNADSIVRTDLRGTLMTHVADALSGAAAMASLADALFFLKFWRRTRDTFFLLFAAAFAIDAASRFALGISQVSDTAKPIYFLPV